MAEWTFRPVAVEIKAKGTVMSEANGKAKKSAAGAARFALGAVPEDRGVVPVAVEELVAARSELNQRPELARVLQFAVQGLDLPNPVEFARGFVDDCRKMWRYGKFARI